MTASRVAALCLAASALMFVATLAVASRVLRHRDTGSPHAPTLALLPPVAGATLGGERVSSETLTLGRDLYVQHCAGCHGARGHGDGASGVGLVPAPTDLTRGVYKFGSVPSGELPPLAALRRTLTRGLRGTAMRPWPLSAREVTAVARYVQWLSPRWRRERSGTSIDLRSPEWADPFASDVTAGVARGEAVYHGLAQCTACHPAYVSMERVRAYATELQGTSDVALRPDVETSRAVYEEGHRAWALATDFARHPMRDGDDVASVARSIAMGLGGTPMPTWYGALSPRDIWALAHYVRGLAATPAAPRP